MIIEALEPAGANLPVAPGGAGPVLYDSLVTAFDDRVVMLRVVVSAPRGA